MATIDVWFEAILRFSLLAFLLLGACTVILRFIPQPLERIRSIQIALCCVFFAGLLSLPGWKPAIELPLLPPAELPGPVEHNGAQPGPPSAFSAQVPVETGADPGLNHLVSHSTGGVARDSASAGAALFPARPVDWRGLVKRATVIGFLGISLLQIVYLLFGYAATRRLIASSTPLAKSAEMRVRDAFSPLSARGDIRLRTSANIHVPLVSGVIHPTILLPSDLVADDVAGLPLRHSLAHEWQHILRNDLMTWQLVTLCQVFLWPQPFYWVLRRELRVSQDQIADGFVAEQTGQQVAYAETLVRFARSRQLPALGALSIAGSRSNLLRRVEMLLNDKFCVSASARKPVVFGVATAMLAAVTVLASLQLTRATVRGMEPAEESKPARGEGHKNQNGESIEPVQHSGLVLDAKTQKPTIGGNLPSPNQPRMLMASTRLRSRQIN
jgi:beta-lactamase regulating signal transducer with metallopeptidase domain